MQVVAILEAGESLPFQLRQAEVDLPELQVCCTATLLPGRPFWSTLLHP